MKRNIKINYYIQFIQSFGITNIWMLYLVYKGLPLVQVGLLEAIFHIASLAFELPSGVISDILGRKKTLMVGRIIALISSVLMLSANHFVLFAVAFAFSAMSYALTTGTSEALVYDSLKSINEENDFLKVSARLNIIFEVANYLGLVIAGIIADYYFDGVYIISIALIIITFMLLTLIKEPLILEQNKQDKQSSFTDNIKIAFKILKDNKYLTKLIIISAIIQSIGTTYFYYFQSFMSFLNYSNQYIGWLFLITCIIQIIVVSQVTKIEAKIKQGYLFWQYPLIIAILLIVSGVISSYVVLILFILINSLISMSYPIFSNNINQLIPSIQRATIISVSGMIFSLIMIVLFPVIGLVIDLLSYQIAFIVLASSLIIFIKITNYLFK